MPFESMSHLRAANKVAEHHFFERDTMKFFSSRIESGLYKGRYFVTSEQYDSESPRLYTVRHAREDGTIHTVGEFQHFKTRRDAKRECRAITKSLV